jgi:hypothetical protein
MIDSKIGDNLDLDVASSEPTNLSHERLRRAIRQAGGNNAVSERSGIPLSTIGRYLAGFDMKFAAAQALAKACDVTIEWLATGQNSAVLPVPPQPPAAAAPAPLFQTVHMDMQQRDPSGRPFAQIVCILYDEAKARLDAGDA